MNKLSIINSLKQQFDEKFGSSKDILVSIAPGRVNLIGDHTDYNDGFVLPMTLDRAVYIAMRRRNDDKCRVYSINFNEFAEWNLNSLEKTPNLYWSNYIKGIMKLLLDAGHNINGIEGVIYGDVPVASGLSSSAAVEIATLTALQHLFTIDLSAIEAIKLAQKAENTFIGVQCGIMDQFISRLGKKSHALFIDCRSLEYENIPVSLGDYILLIVDTKIKRELAKSAYNERRASCFDAVKYFQTIYPHIKALRDVDLQMFAESGDKLSSVIKKRARHVVSENQRVLDAITELRNGNLQEFGALLYASHKSLREDYEVSCKELDFVVDNAREYGAIGARMTGAGFGGCGLIIIRKDKAPSLIENITEGYKNIFGFEPSLLQLVDNLEAGIY